MFIFFFKHKTAYELRSSDWSADVCSSDLLGLDLKLLRDLVVPVAEIGIVEGLPAVVQVSAIDAIGFAERRDRDEVGEPHVLIYPEIGRAACRESACE